MELASGRCFPADKGQEHLPCNMINMITTITMITQSPVGHG